MFLILKRSEVEQAVRTGGSVMIEQGAKRNVGMLKKDREGKHIDFVFDAGTDGFQFAIAKKNLYIAIQNAFPGCRFRQEVVQSSGKIGTGVTYVGRGMKGRRLDDRFVNYYLFFEKEN